MAKAKTAATKAKPKAKPKSKPRPQRKPQPRPQPSPSSEHVRQDPIPLGFVTAPSGKLAVFDIGLFGFLPREALEPALVISDAPRDRKLPVYGVKLGRGRFPKNWDYVAVTLGDGERAASHKVGEAGVDFARLMIIDHAALDHWQHEDSLDGRADFVFWGRDSQTLARIMSAPVAPEGYGWLDLSVADAEAKADRAAHVKATNHFLLATDLRPHSHHYRVLAAARATELGTGSIELGGATALMFFTSWGDGVFPVFLDVDAHRRPLQLRIQLSTVKSNAALKAVNRR